MLQIFLLQAAAFHGIGGCVTHFKVRNNAEQWTESTKVRRK